MQMNVQLVNMQWAIHPPHQGIIHDDRSVRPYNSVINIRHNEELRRMTVLLAGKSKHIKIDNGQLKIN